MIDRRIVKNVNLSRTARGDVVIDLFASAAPRQTFDDADAGIVLTKQTALLLAALICELVAFE